MNRNLCRVQMPSRCGPARTKSSRGGAREGENPTKPCANTFKGTGLAAALDILLPKHTHRERERRESLCIILGACRGS